LLKIDFFIIISDVTVTVGCSNVLRCDEIWCSRRGGWWRGRPTNRLDRHADWTDRLPAHVSSSYSSFTLPRDETMPPCYTIDPLWPAHTAPRRAATPANLPLPPHQWNRSVTGTFIQLQRV